MLTSLRQWHLTLPPLSLYTYIVKSGRLRYQCVNLDPADWPSCRIAWSQSRPPGQPYAQQSEEALRLPSGMQVCDTTILAHTLLLLQSTFGPPPPLWLCLAWRLHRRRQCDLTSWVIPVTDMTIKEAGCC